VPVHRKVQAGALGGALGIILVWILSGPAGLDVPPEVGAAISTVTGAALGWLVPESQQELPQVAPPPPAPASDAAIPDEPMPADPGAP
jgi:hypothetical protein